MIRGIPNTLNSSMCSIIAKNEYYTSNPVYISIIINKQKCGNDKEWHEIESGLYSYLLCDEGYGFKIRKCEEDITYNCYWSDIDQYQCSSKEFNPSIEKNYVKFNMIVGNISTINNNVIFAIQMGISNVLNINPSVIYILNQYTKLRSLQINKEFNIYIDSINTNIISSQISNISIQEEIKTNILSGVYSSELLYSNITYNGIEIINKKTSNQIIIYSIIGSVILLLIIIIIGICYIMRNRNKKPKKSSKPH